MLLVFLLLFILSASTMVWLLARKVSEARIAVVLQQVYIPQKAVLATATVGAAAAQAGNLFLRILEKLLRRFKIFALKFDNVSTRWIHRVREKSKDLSLRYHDWRVQKHGTPNISFDSSFIDDIEEKFDGFFYKYFRRGVGYNRSAVRDDLEVREKVLVGAILANPKDVEAYRALGIYYFEKGNLPDALSAFEAIRKIDPTNSEAAERAKHLREVIGISEEP